MKLEYQMLTRKEPCFKAMALEWSNDKEKLKQVMDMMCFNDEGLKYETTLQLSMFLLMPERSEVIVDILKRNNQILASLLQDFELDKPDQDFEALISKMLHKLQALSDA